MKWRGVDKWEGRKRRKVKNREKNVTSIAMEAKENEKKTHFLIKVLVLTNTTFQETQKE